jgi:hypothetical protein
MDIYKLNRAFWDFSFANQTKDAKHLRDYLNKCLENE